MIYIASAGNRQDVQQIVQSALGRSFTDSMVCNLGFPLWKDKLAESKVASNKQFFLVLVDPLESWVELIVETYETANTKMLILGAMPSKLADYLNVSVEPLTEELVVAGSCSPAQTFNMAESELEVVYQQSIGVNASPITRRPFLRFDFTDEWNNLGYGAIRVDGSIWALSSVTHVPDNNSIAQVMLHDVNICSYAALWDEDHASLLWFNRSVGPIDSAEWYLVESFFGDYRAVELPCIPFLSEVPYGYKSAVTMRLDCDEDIESARPLWETYQQMGVPLSLAIHTNVLTEDAQYQLPRDVLTHGGAILSHTATHAPDWGGHYNAALSEAETSFNLIKTKIGNKVSYAVSPFHQTPIYARTALSDIGYRGCIGGIIRNDPDFLMARSGRPPFSSNGFIGHSQQCMLHGDCMLTGGDPLSIYKQAFDIAYKSNTFFGYLDHPFSSRYQYGWHSEEQRINIHQAFIDYIKKHDGVLFANENDAMDFLSCRTQVRIEKSGQSYIVNSQSSMSKWPMRLCYQGLTYKLGSEKVIL